MWHYFHDDWKEGFWMKQRFPLRLHIMLLSVLLFFMLTLATAYSDADHWVLPWYGYDHNLMTSAIVSGSNVASTVSGTTQQSGDRGYYHYMNVTFDYNLRNYLTIIAPAGGSVVYSDKTKLDVRTYGGDVYELAVVSTSSYMVEFSTGTQIGMGEEVGKVYLLSSRPMLQFQYLIGDESTDLFGLNRRYYVDGADLTDYAFITYDASQSSGSSSLPDLELVSIAYNGTSLYNAFQPNYPIYFSANVSIAGNFNGSYAVRWTVYNEYGNIQKWSTLTYSAKNPENQPLFTWTPQANGTYNIACIIDADDRIAESDEDNNGKYFYIDVDDFK